MPCNRKLLNARRINNSVDGLKHALRGIVIERMRAGKTVSWLIVGNEAVLSFENSN
jgi:hypothetical protein